MGRATLSIDRHTAASYARDATALAVIVEVSNQPQFDASQKRSFSRRGRPDTTWGQFPDRGSGWEPGSSTPSSSAVTARSFSPPPSEA
jgi:hypothetical protein